MGFPVPFALWMKNEWQSVARDVLLDRRTRERGIIEPRAVDELITAHANGRQEGGDAIWSLLNLELWYRTFIDGEGVQTLGAGAVGAGAIAGGAGAGAEGAGTVAEGAGAK